MGSRRVGYDWATSLSLFTFMHWRRKWQPTPVFLPGESQGRGAWWAAVYGVAQRRTRLKQLSSSRKCILVFLPRKSHGQRSLPGYKELDKTEQLSFFLYITSHLLYRNIFIKLFSVFVIIVLIILKILQKSLSSRLCSFTIRYLELKAVFNY